MLLLMSLALEFKRFAANKEQEKKTPVKAPIG
jgi:hypothetical protein